MILSYLTLYYIIFYRYIYITLFFYVLYVVLKAQLSSPAWNLRLAEAEQVADASESESSGSATLESDDEELSPPEKRPK